MKDPDHPEPSLGLKRFLRAAQRDVGVIGEVNVRIASDNEMRRLNRDFRGKDKPTDVLSFPASQNGNRMPAGDIAISADIARANAKALGHSFEEELKILLLHGLLHLAGHDHESDHGEMNTLEQSLRAKLKLPTGLIERSSVGTRKREGEGEGQGEPAAPGRVFRRASKNAVRDKAEPLPRASNGNRVSTKSTKHTAEGGRLSLKSAGRFS
jgi:probable rRNA maturation factor